MASEIPNITEIIKLLPRPLQIRFNSIGSFVKAVVEEKEAQGGRKAQLSQEETDLIQLAAFIYSLNWFLTEGTKAAQATISTLDNFGLEGFLIGSTPFEKDNENTMRGKILAEAMMQNIGDPNLARRIQQATSMTSLIINLRNDLTRG